jgi:hypothetical protein
VLARGAGGTPGMSSAKDSELNKKGAGTPENDRPDLKVELAHILASADAASAATPVTPTRC